MLRRKIKQEKGVLGGTGCDFQQGDEEGLAEGVTLEQRPGGGGEASVQVSGEEGSRQDEHRKPSPGVRSELEDRRACVAGGEQARGRVGEDDVRAGRGGQTMGSL